MHFKVHSPGDWRLEDFVVTRVPIASRGLTGSDRSDFIKRAGEASNVFLPLIDSVSFDRDTTPLHVIALGSTEGYGSNRNGDGFKEAECRKHHNTFVKYGKWFRDHKNKSAKGDLHYGTIKASAYNEGMRRVELLVGLFNDKKAAERDGPQARAADKELQKLESGQLIPVSMSCKVAYDVCSYCGNKAKTRDEYCTTEKCAAGGCSKNLGKLVKMGSDIHVLHVDNPNPIWFDISSVWRPADPIAYAGRADYIKAASFGDRVIGGSELAEMWGIVGDDSSDSRRSDRLRTLSIMKKLAAELNDDPSEMTKTLKSALASCELTPDRIGYRSDDPEKIAASLRGLLDRNVILSPREFSNFVGLPAFSSETLEKAAEILERKPALLDSSLLDASDESAPPRGDVTDYALRAGALQKRAFRATLRTPRVEAASAADDIDSALAYAIYKAAALAEWLTTAEPDLIGIHAACLQNLHTN